MEHTLSATDTNECTLNGGGENRKMNDGGAWFFYGRCGGEKLAETHAKVGEGTRSKVYEAYFLAFP